MMEGEVWGASHPVQVCGPDGQLVPQPPGSECAEQLARVTNLDDLSEVGLGVLEAAIVGGYVGIKNP